MKTGKGEKREGGVRVSGKNVREGEEGQRKEGRGGEKERGGDRRLEERLEAARADGVKKKTIPERYGHIRQEEGEKEGEEKVLCERGREELREGGRKVEKGKRRDKGY